MKNRTTLEAEAHRRLQLILEVQAGRKTATEAAAALGISRQAFHQWEKRGMHALFQSLSEQSPGRPATPENPEQEAMREKIQRLEHDLAVTGEIAELRGALLRQLEEEAAQEANRGRFKKKPTASAKSSSEPSA